MCDNGCMKKIDENREREIAAKYVNNVHAAALGKEYGLSTRQVQRICKKLGVIKTRSESYRLAIKQGRMRYYRKPEHLKFSRRGITAAQRLRIFIRDRYHCRICGMGREDEVKLTIDHIDEDFRNNKDRNLQVLCLDCNQGKWQNSAKYQELQEDQRKWREGIDSLLDKG